MRIITGSIKPTPLEWLPILSNIASPHLRRTNALIREKITANQDLPLNNDIVMLNHPPRLKSRRHTVRSAKTLLARDFDRNTEWRSNWLQKSQSGIIHVDDPKILLDGLDMPRHLWVRIRTNCGRCEDSLFNWGLNDSAACDCGARNQTIKHIVTECPRRAYPGELADFVTITPSVIEWLNNLDLEF